MSDRVRRMVRNTPRKGISWRTRLWRRMHARHGAPIQSVTQPAYRDDPFGMPRFRADLSTVYERCGKGHQRRVR